MVREDERLLIFRSRKRRRMDKGEESEGRRGLVGGRAAPCLSRPRKVWLDGCLAVVRGKETKSRDQERPRHDFFFSIAA